MKLDLMDWLFYALMMLTFLAIVGTAYVVWDAVTSPSFSLRKDEWRCTQSHVESVAQTTMVGKVPVTNYVPTTVCDQWTRGQGE